VNGQIHALWRLSALGIAVLISITAYWQIWAAPSLAVREDNARLIVRQLQIDRGLILAADGRTEIARNRKVRRNGQDLYLRVYPLGETLAHPVGYNTVGSGRSGIEEYRNDYLTASNADLSTLLGRVGDRLQGQTVRGNTIVTSLDVDAQRAAMDGLAGQSGAVVALEPGTGRVVAMASTPTFNPTTVAEDFRQLERTQGAPLLNRATQGLYAPGSTFKVVTAAGALDRGLLTPGSLIDSNGSCITVQTRPLCNFGGESFGTIDLTTALTHSVNTAFARVGEQLGPARLRATMDDFGFFSEPPLDYPSDELEESGLYEDGRPLPEDTPIDVARVAIGQERLAVTPLQMASVAATVANGGVRMKPSLVDRAVAPDGDEVFRTEPQELGRAISAGAAAELGTMMEDVVNEGTGTAAALQGIPVAGKTGTAETGVAGRNNVWFIAFAPADRPRVAIAVVVEGSSGTGGVVAAPIARDVIVAYLGSGVANSG
jgi:penicillin-binding protein A